MGTLGKLFVAQFGQDILDGSNTLSDYSIRDLSAIAHGLALRSPELQTEARRCEELVLELIWAAAEPKLRRAQPHLVLMLLNAMVRGGSEKLLTSPRLLEAV